jgi:hypothetical protein
LTKVLFCDVGVCEDGSGIPEQAPHAGLLNKAWVDTTHIVFEKKNFLFANLCKGGIPECPKHGAFNKLSVNCQTHICWLSIDGVNVQFAILIFN